MERALGVAAYPVCGPARERPLVAGWVLCLSAVVLPVVPLVIFVGYLVRVLAASVDGDAAPPLVADARSLGRAAVGGTVVATAYLAVPLAVLLVTVYGAMTRDPSTSFDAMATFYAGSTAVLCLALVGGYLCPIALTRFGRTASLRAAFAGGSLRATATHAAYFARWVLGAVVLAVTIGIAVALVSIPGLGPVVAALLAAYGSIIAAHVWGRAIGRTERFSD